jgi:hypothetical protein
VFVPGKPFQPSLIYVGKQGAYPRVEHLKGATWIGSGLTRNNWIRLERIVRDKHSSLVKKIVNYVRKKFDRFGPCRFITLPYFSLSA